MHPSRGFPTSKWESLSSEELTRQSRRHCPGPGLAASPTGHPAQNMNHLPATCALGIRTLTIGTRDCPETVDLRLQLSHPAVGVSRDFHPRRPTHTDAMGCETKIDTETTHKQNSLEPKWPPAFGRGHLHTNTDYVDCPTQIVFFLHCIFFFFFFIFLSFSIQKSNIQKMAEVKNWPESTALGGTSPLPETPKAPPFQNPCENLCGENFVGPVETFVNPL